MKKLLLALALGLGLFSSALAVQPVTQPGNAAYTMVNTDTFVVTTTAFSAARTWTLPFAAGTCIGQICTPQASQLQVIDAAATITATNTLTIAPASGDTINGNAANIVLAAAGARVVLIPTSANNWQATTTGNYQQVLVANAGKVALSTTTAKTITTLALSQGIWDCTGTITRVLAATTSVTLLKTSISGTTDTSGTLDLGTMKQMATAANVMATDTSDTIIPPRLSLAATTSVFLVAQDTFTVDTNAGQGLLRCSQVR